MKRCPTGPGLSALRWCQAVGRWVLKRPMWVRALILAAVLALLAYASYLTNANSIG